MVSNLIISTASKNAALNAVLSLINAGSATGYLNIYDGTQPAGPGTAVTTQNRLAHLTFSNPAFPNASNGSAAANAITSDTNAVAGTAAWFRITDNSGNAIIDGSVGTSGSDINFNTVSFSAGATIAVSSLTFTHP